MMLTILTGDAIEQLRTLPDESVHCCVTSPPYWGLRDYSTNGQLGLEKTPAEYVAKMVEVFREVRRVLRKDGTLWLNLGDSYASAWPAPANRRNIIGQPMSGGKRSDLRPNLLSGVLKEKDLCGIPWRVAFALQADGWWLRSDIIWAKPNPMPESVTDRPTKAHEYLFLLTKSANYFYDAEAIREPVQEWNTPTGRENAAGIESQRAVERESLGALAGGRGWKVAYNNPGGRNKRSVWTVATAPYRDAHFATYPPDLIKPCILAGTSAKGCCAKCGSPWERQIDVSYQKGYRTGHLGYNARGNADGMTDMSKYPALDKITKTIGWQPTCQCDADTIPCTVLDPFAGSGTTGAVALELGRKAILIELNPKYVELIEQRCTTTFGLALT